MQTTLLRTRSMRRMTHNAILDKNSSISMGAVCCQASDSSSRFISNELLVTIFNSADLATRGVSLNELNENYHYGSENIIVIYDPWFPWMETFFEASPTKILINVI